MTTAQFLSEMKSILVTTSTYLHRNAWTFIFFLGGAYAYSNSCEWNLILFIPSWKVIDDAF